MTDKNSGVENPMIKDFINLGLEEGSEITLRLTVISYNNEYIVCKDPLHGTIISLKPHLVEKVLPPKIREGDKVKIIDINGKQRMTHKLEVMKIIGDLAWVSNSEERFNFIEETKNLKFISREKR